VVAGRATGLTEEKLARIGADPLPEGLYTPDEAVIVRYARASSRLEPITDELYTALLEHFDEKKIIEICFTVGMANMINRFHATFHTDVDADTQEMLGAVCPVPLPPAPGGSAQVRAPEVPG
jgi:alkylhydroperoxidase family enzyme